MVLIKSPFRRFLFYFVISGKYQWPFKMVFLVSKQNAQNILECGPCPQSAFAEPGSLDHHTRLSHANRKIRVCLGTAVSSALLWMQIYLCVYWSCACDRVRQEHARLGYYSVSWNQATFIPFLSKALSLNSRPVIAWTPYFLWRFLCVCQFPLSPCCFAVPGCMTVCLSAKQTASFEYEIAFPMLLWGGWTLVYLLCLLKLWALILRWQLLRFYFSSFQ